MTFPIEKLRNIGRDQLSSNKRWKELLGALLNKWYLLLLAALLIAAAFAFGTESPKGFNLWHAITSHTLFRITAITLLLVFAISVCHTLTDIYVLLKKETLITVCQIAILVAIGLWVIGVLLIIDIKDNPRSTALMAIIGSVLTWIFQDTVKGVVAFIHLRYNHLLNIDDWIKIPTHGIDGEVKRVTLTTVMVYNWDTTTSTIPTGVLHTSHFINLKRMMDGKTYGRHMQQKFILDSSWFHNLSAGDAASLNANADVTAVLPQESIAEGTSNAQLFRLYLYHWLMNHPHISQQPRLVVRWLDQSDSGMPLELYAFIIDSSLASFEWQRSQIVEHVIAAMEWFGLRLYQAPSAFDVSNANVFLSDKSATHNRPSLS